MSAQSKERLEVKFWTRVQKTKDCWLWMGQRNSRGYGQLEINGRREMASRLVLYLINGKHPPKAMLVCHHCDNPSCVNPSHLFLGTMKDNKQDSVNKGRHSRGETCGKSKLKNNDVLEMRRLHVLGVSLRDLGRKFNVSRENAGHIIKKNTWKHI